MNCSKITKEWLAWVKARKAGYTGDIVWSDQPGYEGYRANLQRSHTCDFEED